MIYLVIIYISAGLVDVARGSCLSMATQKAMACTSQLDIGIFAGSSPNKSIGHGNMDRLVLACRNGDLLNAIGCLEMVMGECKDSQTDDAFILRKMIDTKKARTSIDFFCANIRVYNANIECIVRHHKQQDVCARDAKNSYQMQASSGGNVYALLLVHCAFYQVLMECVQRVLQVKCSQQAASIVKTVMEGFEPPICSEKTTKTTTTTTTTTAVASVVTTDKLCTQCIQSENNDSNDLATSYCSKPSTHYMLMVLFTILILA
ncbi:hypothetical protein BsWGS_13986 [Bradybaena similaris]